MWEVAPLSPPTTGSLVVPKEGTMAHIPYLFNQTIEQMRRIGARGGRTHARNWRARQVAAMSRPREVPTPDTPPQLPGLAIARNPVLLGFFRFLGSLLTG